MNDKDNFKIPSRKVNVRRAKTISNLSCKKKNDETLQKYTEVDELEKSLTQIDIHSHIDNYFHNMCSSKILAKTPYSKLGSKRLTAEEIKSLFDKIPPSPCEELIIKRLEFISDEIFPKIAIELESNYNIILYGYGSKKSILESFRKVYLKDENCMVVNGFLPSINMQKILLEIIEQFTEDLTIISKINSALLDVIEEYFNRSNDKLYLFVNNMDSNFLVNHFVELIRLCNINNINVIATVDNIKADYLTNGSKGNFIWHDCTNYLPYTTETIINQSELINDSINSGMQSLRALMKSLPMTTKKLFLILVNYQLEGVDAKDYIGMPLDILFKRSKEAFLVNNELNLRQQLTEFKDHKLVYFRVYNTSEYIKISLEKSVIQEFKDNFEDF